MVSGHDDLHDWPAQPADQTEGEDCAEHGADPGHDRAPERAEDHTVRDRQEFGRKGHEGMHHHQADRGRHAPRSPGLYRRLDARGGQAEVPAERRGDKRRGRADPEPEQDRKTDRDDASSGQGMTIICHGALHRRGVFPAAQNNKLRPTGPKNLIALA